MSTSSRAIFYLIAAIVIASGPTVISPAFAGHAVVSCGDGTTWDDSCSGGGGGSSGPNYVAPAPSGPSPAEIARRRRRAEAIALDRRALAAADKHDLTKAVRLYEQAARLAPSDSNIQGNFWYAKGMLAERDDDLEEAIYCYEKAHRYFPSMKAVVRSIEETKYHLSLDRGDWDTAARRIGTLYRIWKVDAGTKKAYQYYFAAGHALSAKQWMRAGKSMRKFLDGAFVAMGQTIEKELNDASDALGRGDLTAALRGYKKALARRGDRKEFVNKAFVPEIKAIASEVARQEQTLSAKARPPAEQASNPNYPKPPPIYRDASTPRSYPKLDSYTKAQRTAHAENETGNLMAQKGDWVQAMLAYQQALMEDPNGPFTDVIKRNLDLARSHLGPAKKAAAAAPATAPAPADSTTLVRQSEPPQDVAAPNCTGWMAQADGSSYRLCTDAKAERYCEQAKAGTVSRVACQ